MDMEVSHFRLVSAADVDTDDVFEPSETEYKKQLNDALGATADAKVLTFSEKAPVAKEGTVAISNFCVFLLLACYVSDVYMMTSVHVYY